MKSQRTTNYTSVLSLAVIFLFGSPLHGQSQNSDPTSGGDAAVLHDLVQQVQQLRAVIEDMRTENAQSRAEMHELRQELQATRALLQNQPENSQAAAQTSQPEPLSAIVPAGGQAPRSLDERVQKLEESTSLLGSKIDEQYQTKVETASKYRARLHGIVLMNASRNIGRSDNLDLPTYAESSYSALPRATFSATLRQSEIGLEIFGPKVAGAKTSADVQLDFAGGFPATGNGVNFGIARLQTANLRFDWDHTSVVAGQDSLFISPLTPTSFASLAIPTFAFAGNLWGWTPQLRLEHRFAISDRQTFTVQGGILDNLDWENPYNSFYRTTQAGELSGQPAYALRTSWTRSVNEHPLSFGVAGYYGRQNWAWDRNIDAWAAMADWQVPILPHVSLSGEFYRGRGIGGLGGAVGVSILYGGDPTLPFTPIRGFDTAGGWTQIKWQLTPKLELNGAIAEDDGFAGNVRGFATDQNNFGPIIGRNRGALGNIVFRPRSDLILSAELKRLRSFPVYSSSSLTTQASISAGILF